MNIVPARYIASVIATFAVVAPVVTFAAPVERVDGFVCPVISTDAVLNSARGGAISGGDYTIGGPDVSVPIHATNADGTGTPGGDHSRPGDTDYSAIWGSR
jgi:hypothetical protein